MEDNGYNGWKEPLIVTLTDTTNPYLKDRLPIRGELQVLEMRVDGYAQPRRFIFLELDENGKGIGTRVMVDHAKFTYEGV